MTDVMIDIETLDTAPTAAILSIGAVKFDLARGAVGNGPRDRFHRAVSLSFDEFRLFTVSRSTVDFWLSQSAEARRAVVAGDEPTERVDFEAALDGLASFVARAERVWARGPAFDLAILRHAYRVVLRRANPPWSHKVERDSRTFEFVARALGVVAPAFEPPFLTREHHALDDAVAEAHRVIAVFRSLEAHRADRRPLARIEAISARLQSLGADVPDASKLNVARDALTEIRGIARDTLGLLPGETPAE